VRILTFDGKLLSDKSQTVEITPLSSKVYLTMLMLDITNLPNCDLGKIVLVADLLVDNKPISSNELFFVPTKDIQLPQAQVTSEVTPASAGGTYTLHLSSAVLARNVYVSFGNIDAKPADNYFDLLPGQSVDLTITSAASLDELQKNLKVISLTDAFAPHEAQVSAGN
jgi:beta-mannosidase